MQREQGNIFIGGGNGLNDKILSMSGMARRMRKVSSGGFITEKSIKSGTARLVIIACDASEKTKKSIKDLCVFRNVPWIEYSDMFALGKCIGTEARAVISINDEGIADAVLRLYKNRFSE